jgi:ATP-dependent Clp endopeptidase proteolytic subunit ClpP
MLYVVDETVARPIMLIDKHIGYDEDEGYGINGGQFARELMTLDSMGKEGIDVWINSPGGIVLDGYNIYNAILQSKTKVNTVCVGMAASIAAVIFQAGRERIMCDYGILMYHNPFGSENTDALKAMRDSIVTMIAQRCGMTEDDVMAMMRREPFMLAQEALDLKLCDSIQVSGDYNKKRTAPAAARNDVKAYFKEATAILNSILPKTNNNMDFKRIANRLNLNPEASEDAILAGITAIENRATKAEGDLATVRNQVTALEADKTKLTGEITTLKNQITAAETEGKKIKAQALVAAAAKLGTIKNDAGTIAKWTEKATTDYDGTKDLLESLPVNKNATTIQVDSSAEAKTILENQAAIEMVAIKNRLLGINVK